MFLNHFLHLFELALFLALATPLTRTAAPFCLFVNDRNVCAECWTQSEDLSPWKEAVAVRCRTSLSPAAENDLVPIGFHSLALEHGRNFEVAMDLLLAFWEEAF